MDKFSKPYQAKTDCHCAGCRRRPVAWACPPSSSTSPPGIRSACLASRPPVAASHAVLQVDLVYDCIHSFACLFTLFYILKWKFFFVAKTMCHVMDGKRKYVDVFECIFMGVRSLIRIHIASNKKNSLYIWFHQCCHLGLQYEQDEYGAVSQYGQYGPEQRVEKFIGVDATSDGRTSGPNYRTNLLRYMR